LLETVGEKMSAQNIELETLSFLARRSGKERAWLLCHGFTGSPRSWDEVAQGLCLAADVFALEIPGHGGRDEGLQETSFPCLVAKLASTLPVLHKGPFYLGGYSLGGRIALALAVAHPELCRGLVILGASPGLEREKDRQERRAWEKSWVEVLRRDGLAAFLDAWQRLPLFASQALLKEAECEVQRRIRSSHDASGLAMALDGLGLAAMPNLWPQLQNVDLPVKIVVGEHDEKFRRIGAAMVKRLPRAKMDVVPGVGHNVLLEAPGRTLKALEEIVDDD
jgi:2-succinyl-6-hydroxy-2,4-cyclohexadiene-1-carboxylate synthase